MGDAATTEIARVQLWQCAFHKARLDTGHSITTSYVGKILQNAAENAKSLVSGVSDKHIQIARDYMVSQIKAERASDFLTSDLLPYLEQLDGGKWVKSSL